MRKDIEQVIKKFGIVTFGFKYHIERAHTILNEDETVLFFTVTNYTVNSNSNVIPAIVFLTDKRIIFYHRLEFGQFGLDVMPISEIHSVSCNVNGLGKKFINIHAITKSYNFFVINKKGTINQIYQEFETAINNYKAQQAAQSSSPQPNAPQPDIADQIEKLAQLRDKGIITEEEFQAKKTDLLSRM